MSRADAPVLIAGGGIAGLSAALALAQRGIRSAVFEARSEVPGEGAGIQLGPNATRLLIALGVEEGLRHSLVAPDAIAVNDGVSGRLLTRLPLGDAIRRRHGAPYWVVHRADLYRALAEAAERVPAISLTFGRTVADVIDDSGGIAIRFAEGGAASGRLLIAADGIWSRLRARFAPGLPLSETGITAARAVMARDAVPARFRENVTGIWLAPQAHVVHYPVHGGASLALVAIAPGGEAGHGWNAAVDAAAVLARFQGLSDTLADLLGRAGAWRQWALMQGRNAFAPTGDGDSAPGDGGLVFIGDAAHPIRPFLAQGGALAIEDGVVLAGLIADHGGAAGSIGAAFARLRARRVEAVQAASRENGRIYHLDGAARLARNATLKLTPGGLLMRRYDWLYGWRPDGY